MYIKVIMEKNNNKNDNGNDNDNDHDDDNDNDTPITIKLFFIEWLSWVIVIIVWLCLIHSCGII